MIHAGDYTRFAKESDAVSFNDWLGQLRESHSFKAILVVNGNHENGLFRKVVPHELLSNAIVLRVSFCGEHARKSAN